MMRWPLMSVRVHERCIESYHVDLNAALCRVEAAERREERAVAYWQQRYDALLDKYHELRVKGAEAPIPAPPAVDIAEPDQPPDVVLAAMKQISPVRDKTYEANWAHWEQNKERAAAYPKDFADEIILGNVSFGDEVRH